MGCFISKTYKKSLLLTIFLLLSTLSLFAKFNETFHPIYLSEEETLNECLKITKDDQGYMWIAYSEGVARYDGATIKEYPLEYNFNRTIHKMSDGGVVVIEEFEKFRAVKYDPITDAFFDITPFVEGLSSGAVMTDSAVDEFNNLWIATNEGLVCYIGDRGEWLYLDMLRGTNILSICSYDDCLAIVDREQIHMLQIKKDVTQSIYILNVKTPDNFAPTVSLYDDGLERIYFGTISHTVMFLDLKKMSFGTLPSMNFGNVTIKSLCIYDETKLLIGTDGLGIMLVDKWSGEILRHFRYYDRYNYTILSNAIYDIFVDEQKRIYAATYAHSIQVLDSEALDYSLLIPRTEDGKIVNTNVNTLYEEQDGKRLLLGTDQGLFAHDFESKEWVKYKFDGACSELNKVIMDVESVGDDIYVGGYGCGLLKLDHRARVLRRILPLSKVDDDNYLFELLGDSDGNLWVGGISSVAKYNIERDEISHYGLRGGISAIASIDDNNLIYCAAYDLFMINVETKEITPFSFPDSIVEKVGVVPKVRDVIKRGNKLYFAANNCGLIEYDLVREEFRSFQSVLGDDYRNILAFEIDNLGVAWITASKGIAYLDLESGAVRSYHRTSLANVDSFVKGASLLTQDGKVIFGTLNGALVIDTNVNYVEREYLQPRIIDFSISYNSVLRHNNLIELDEPLNDMEEIELGYKQNTFSFKFNHIDYSRFDRPLYSWKLDNFDNEWCPPTANDEAEYRNIPPGDYTLKFRVYPTFNSDQYAEKEIRLHILQPWYARWYMIIVYALFLLTLVIGAFILYINQQEKRESQERVDYYMNALHALHTPIMLIKAPLEYIKRELSVTSTTLDLLSIVSKNVDRIYSLVNQQIDYRASVKKDDLEIQEISLADYFREMMDNFWEYAVANNVTLRLNFLHANSVVFISRDILDKVLDNLISNAIKYSVKSGDVTITVDCDPYRWSVNIHNTGCLIPLYDQRYIFKRVYRANNSVNTSIPSSGLGLLFTSRFVNQLGGEISFESDRRRGTTFTVEFPNQIAGVIGEDEIAVDVAIGTVSLQRVLIFDDNSEIEDLLKRRFVGRYSLERVDLLSDVVVADGDVALILLNMSQPNRDLMELCRQIRANNSLRSVDIIAIASKSDEESMMLGAEYGIVDMIVAPYTDEEVVVRVEQVLMGTDSEDIIDKEGISMSEVDSAFMDQVDEIIKANISNHNFNIDTICKGVCMSRSVFYNRMKSITSLTPNEMLRSARMNYAADLLRSKKYTILEVSDMVGFADPKYFSRVFFKYHKCYPSKYLG